MSTEIYHTAICYQTVEHPLHKLINLYIFLLILYHMNYSCAV